MPTQVPYCGLCGSIRKLYFSLNKLGFFVMIYEALIHTLVHTDHSANHEASLRGTCTSCLSLLEEAGMLASITDPTCPPPPPLGC